MINGLQETVLDNFDVKRWSPVLIPKRRHDLGMVWILNILLAPEIIPSNCRRRGSVVPSE